MPIALVNVCMSEPGFSPGLLWEMPHPMLLFAPHCYYAKLIICIPQFWIFFSYVSFWKVQNLEQNGMKLELSAGMVLEEATALCHFKTQRSELLGELGGLLLVYLFAM